MKSRHLSILFATLITCGAGMSQAQSVGSNGATYPTEPGAASQTQDKSTAHKSKRIKKVASTEKRSTAVMGSSQAGIKEKE